MVERAGSGWQINLISFNMVPGDSPVWTFVVNDDWAGLSELFSQGRASPYDTDVLDWSLLDVSGIPKYFPKPWSRTKLIIRPRLPATAEVTTF